MRTLRPFVLSFGVGLGGVTASALAGAQPASTGAPAASAAVAPPLGRADQPRALQRSRSFPYRNALLIGGAGVTIASLGLGLTSIAVFSTAGNRAREDHEPASGPSAKTEAELKSVAVWSFITAGVIGGATIVYKLKSDPQNRAPVTGSLFVGPTGGAASLRVEF